VIAYLETLRSGANNKFGAGTKGPIRVPHGFKIEPIATGLTGATAMETLDDGRVLLCEQTGALRVIKNGELLDQPLLTVEVDENWERGLIGVTVHPDFPSTPLVYVCYVAKDPYPHHRVSHFTVDGDRVIDGSERILLRGDDQTKLGGEVPAGHQGGALHFGRDGKLYVGIGEQTAKTPAQKLDTFQGKILRINDDGSIPADNPFVKKTTGKYRAIWAIGCRNPFTFAVDAETGEMLVNDVGGEFEEINRGVAGANYGWPTLDHGMTNEEGFVGPIHVYPQASISGGDFAPSAAGDSYSGRYFFADFVHGWIKSLDPKHSKESVEFVSGLRRPVDLRFAADGSLYVLLRNAWVIDRKFQGDTGSLLRIHRSDSGHAARSDR
jgi:glucose/arabinose dehydrogenase